MGIERKLRASDMVGAIMQGVSEGIARSFMMQQDTRKRRCRGFRSHLVSAGQGTKRELWINPSKTYPYSSARQQMRQERQQIIANTLAGVTIQTSYAPPIPYAQLGRSTKRKIRKSVVPNIQRSYVEGMIIADDPGGPSSPEEIEAARNFWKLGLMRIK